MKVFEAQTKRQRKQAPRLLGWVGVVEGKPVAEIHKTLAQAKKRFEQVRRVWVWIMTAKPRKPGEETEMPTTQSEWQPVRIALPDNHCHFRGKVMHGPEGLSGRRQDSGKIIRVRPCIGMAGWTCGGRIFEIHPDDIRKINNTDNVDKMETCEHQILAD